MSQSPQKIGAFSLLANVSLAALKILVGAVGNSYALIADGIESVADCLSSLIVWNGLRVSAIQADRDHPYGHGKAEALAALLASIGLVFSAGIIFWHAINEIFSNHQTPALFTVPAMILIISIKEALYQYTLRAAVRHDSTALQAEAWHHRSDSLTSLGVLAGIIIAVSAGPNYAYFDDLAASAVTFLILFNAWKIAKPAMDELMDRRIEGQDHRDIFALVCQTPGVLEVETLIARRSGRGYLVEVHLVVDPEITVNEGHLIAHRVKDHLLASDSPKVLHVTTHVEPHHRSAAAGKTDQE